MRILIINGSPRGKASSTMHLTRAFIEGLKKEGDVMDTIDIVNYDIRGCQGCMSCWATNGICAIKDDAPRLQEELFFKADLVIWSFPLYFFGLPSQLKAFMDRLFLSCYPDMVVDKNGFPSHPLRHDVETRHFAISTCGFYTAYGLYDAVQTHFKIVFKDKFAGIIASGQGGLFSKDTAAAAPYLAKVREAGREFAQLGTVSDGLQNDLAKPLISKEKYMENVNNLSCWQHKYDHSRP